MMLVRSVLSGVLTVLVLCAEQAAAATDKQETELLRHLLTSYSADTMPQEGENETFNVHFGMALVHLDVDNTKGIVDVFSFERYKWKDYRLQWDPDAHSGIRLLRVQPSAIWTPINDWKLYNSIRPELEVMDSPNVLLWYTGACLWVPRTTRTVLCAYEDAETYTCTMRFGSWTRDADLLSPALYNDSHMMDLSDYLERNPYEVLSNVAEIKERTYPCCREVYPSMYFNFTIRRKAGYTNSGATWRPHPATYLLSVLLMLCGAQ